MLKRPLVSLFHSLKLKGRRYYWEPPNNQEILKTSLIKQKYDIPKEIIDILENQEKNQIIITEQLTNQKKVIEKILLILKEIELTSNDSR
jgi:hypothetical protein